MSENKRIHFIAPLPPKREKRVGIYCRVSTNSAEQLKSLSAQISALTRLTAANPKWLLVDVYIDIASSKTGSSRKEFTRMLQDCKARDIEIVLTKSISRFGRVMLSNEKYIGNLRLLDNGKHSASYLSEDNNPAIISKETFQAVQIEKHHRSNVIKGEEGSRRKSKKYSSKP